MSDYKASFSKLRDESFGVRIVCDADDAGDFEAGDKVKVTQKNGDVKKRVIDKVIWSGDADREGEEGKVVIIASLVPDGGPPGRAGVPQRGGGGSRRASTPKTAADDGDDIPF